MIHFLRSLILLAVTLYGVGASLDITDGTARAERLISSSAGLDLRKVYFSIATQQEFHGQLYDYAIAKLAKAGLFPIHEQPYKQGAPFLKLTIEPTPLEMKHTAKVLYKTHLELYENVYTERTPSAKVWAVTWFYGLPDPVVTEAVSLDRLRNDLDALLDGFIIDYKVANPDKR